jgi:hypothetical protein
MLLLGEPRIDQQVVEMQVMVQQAVEMQVMDQQVIDSLWSEMG